MDPIKAFLKSLAARLGYEIVPKAYFDTCVSMPQWGLSPIHVLRKTITHFDHLSFVFDVGANVGRTALNYNSLFTKATIHAF